MPQQQQIKAHWDLMLHLLPLLAVPKFANHRFQSTMNGTVKNQQTKLSNFYFEPMSPVLRIAVSADSFLSRRAATCQHLTLNTLP